MKNEDLIIQGIIALVISFLLPLLFNYWKERKKSINRFQHLLRQRIELDGYRHTIKTLFPRETALSTIDEYTSALDSELNEFFKKRLSLRLFTILAIIEIFLFVVFLLTLENFKGIFMDTGYFEGIFEPIWLRSAILIFIVAISLFLILRMMSVVARYVKNVLSFNLSMFLVFNLLLTLTTFVVDNLFKALDNITRAF